MFLFRNILILVIFQLASFPFSMEVDAKIIRKSGLDLLPKRVTYMNSTHLYLREGNDIVDEQIIDDEENDLMILSVPDHNNVAASNVIMDKTSKYMMLVSVNTAECFIMNKHPVLGLSENEIIKDAFNDDSSPENPKEVLPETTLEIDLKTNVGFEISHLSLPKKFQEYCPKDFIPKTAHMFVEGHETDAHNITSEAEAYDYVPDELVPNVRHKRECRDFQNQIVPDCYFYHQATCNNGAGCENAAINYRCNDCKGCSGNCWYYTLPCSYTNMETNTKQCFAHMKHLTQKCSVCCRGMDCGGVKKCPTE